MSDADQHGVTCDGCLMLTMVTRAEAAEMALERVRALGDSWVGFEDSHHYGDAVLSALPPAAWSEVPADE